ncbi:cytochrome P450 [Xylaria venustula]|nr:cytochrome P450 [Xylaria venustula]
MLFHFVLGASAISIVVLALRKLYPTPYAGILYNEDLVPIIQATNEFSSSVFAVTTQKLGTPIAQLLFPATRKPLIILEDHREIEDIVLRRNKEFDKATIELLELWNLKASAVFKDQPFSVHEDFQNAALDAIWVAVVGEEPGIRGYENNKLQNQVLGNTQLDTTFPRGLFLKEEVAYIGDIIARNTNSPVPKWAQKLETYTSRYRKFRSTITTEIGQAMGKAVERFQRLELGKLEADEFDTCMIDLILRRQILDAKRANRPLTDPTKDQNTLDEMFVMLVGGHDSTANALTWFMELRAALNASFTDKRPSVVDILQTNLPYLDATCEETVRLAGVAKGNLRQAVIDSEIPGCKIPKGAEVFMNYDIDRTPVSVDQSKRSTYNQAVMDKHGDGFQGNAGRDLGDFNPRRWLVRDKDTGNEVFNAYALPSIAFGGGYIGCAGRKLASMELRIVITLLILNFEFLELPKERKAMNTTEKIFRQPDMPYVKLRPLI